MGNATTLKARPGVSGCRVRPGVGFLPADISVTLREGPGAQLLPVSLVRNSSSEEHGWDEGQGRKEYRWEAGGGLSRTLGLFFVSLICFVFQMLVPLSPNNAQIP